MDSKHYTELTKRNLEIRDLASAIASEICTEYDRFFSGAEDDVQELIQQTIENELNK